MLSTNISPDVQREMLRQMLTIRRFEERASADYLAGKIYGVVHCYIGEVGKDAPEIVDAGGLAMMPGSSTCTRITTPRSPGTRPCRRRPRSASPPW